MTAGERRQERIELRATSEEKQLLVAAAALEQLDVTSFVLRSALPAAREAVDRAEQIVVSRRDFEHMRSLLGDPPAPTEALLAAVRRSRARSRD
ncbi:MAG: DUF1778 domain-containing protein [Chloroflexi bacterium]|nr:DUF1778 domain-containing protein [Chloroflexota bacterium]MDA1240529.1 DUF1778 domain-containing protein [Chloroflexota bacterium]MQC19307.1 DUF1778 domain-containing protein [Chloroflexota bacterium]